MSTIILLPHQQEVLKQTDDKNRVAYYLDMGLGKTYVGSEKMMQLNKRVNLVICQKSKVNDWVEHFKKHYQSKWVICDLTNKIDFDWFMNDAKMQGLCVGIINYELAFRRPELSKLKDFTLMLDESSLIQNETAKRSKFILKRLQPSNVILLSGTPTSGKYERLWSQMNLLGWNISKKMYYAQYVDMKISPDGYPIITGYKNVDRLKRKMREHGCVFMKSDEVLDLPKQNFINTHIPPTTPYKRFMKSGIVTVEGVELVGDTTLTKLLYARQLCGMYNADKIKAFKDLVDSTEDRLIVFYNFNGELEVLKEVLEDKPISVVNGQIKDLTAYENYDNSVTFVQYQAGSAGLNLQKANKMIYFTPPLSCEHWMQSAKRIHRIGTTSTCFYYKLIVKNSVEERIYQTLDMRENFTNNLFEDFENGDL